MSPVSLTGTLHRGPCFKNQHSSSRLSSSSESASFSFSVIFGQFFFNCWGWVSAISWISAMWFAPLSDFFFPFVVNDNSFPPSWDKPNFVFATCEPLISHSFFWARSRRVHYHAFTDVTHILELRSKGMSAINLSSFSECLRSLLNSISSLPFHSSAIHLKQMNRALKVSSLLFASQSNFDWLRVVPDVSSSKRAFWIIVSWRL